MEIVSSPRIIKSFAMAIATLIVLFISPAAPLAQEVLSLEFVAAEEILVIQDPVEFEIANGMSGPTIYGAFSVQDAGRFADFTEAHQGEVASIVVCGVEVMAPIIQMRIDGGRFSMGGAERNKAMIEFMKSGCP